MLVSRQMSVLQHLAFWFVFIYFKKNSIKNDLQVHDDHNRKQPNNFDKSEDPKKVAAVFCHYISYTAVFIKHCALCVCVSNVGEGWPSWQLLGRKHDTSARLRTHTPAEERTGKQRETQTRIQMYRL